MFLILQDYLLHSSKDCVLLVHSAWKMDPMKRVPFRKASASRIIPSVSVKSEKCLGSLSGSEAQEFYQEVLLNPSTSSQQSGSTGEQKRADSLRLRSQNWEREHSRKRAPTLLLMLAQEGNLRELEKLFDDQSAAVNVNSVDRFKWTALMCAACAGHSKVVQYLLDRGADCDLVNDSGQTACDLAREKRFSRIVEILDPSAVAAGSSINMAQRFNRSTVNFTNKEFFCVACARSFRDTTKGEHQTSTVHLFNIQPKQKGTWYHLTESNKGYQMLLQEGWDKDRGLGPEGKEGIKFPVKTVLKRDRHCLGAGKNKDCKPRVTHFKPYDLRAVKRPRVEKKRKEEVKCRRPSKRQLQREKRKEQQWEIDFRRSFSLG